MLTGCTAVGKTALSLAWARENEAEIISADSLLFYRGMDIGTAKPHPTELAAVPHHLIDILDAAGRMDVKRYVELAMDAVRGIEARGRRVLVVGGSGFYLKAFWAPVADDVPVDLSLREELERQLAADGLAALVARIQKLNPEGTGSLDLQNPRRVARALERCLVSGSTLQELEVRMLDRPGAFADHEVKIVELTREPDELRTRINARVNEMLQAGLVEEVRRLRKAGFEVNPSAAGAIGYREVLEALDAAGDGDEAALAEKIAANTWKLVRKQRTWFRSQMPPHRTIDLSASESIDVSRLFGG